MAAASLPPGLELDLSCEPDLPAVWLDPGAVQDSLLNLILNARDAMAPAGCGTIRVRAVRTGDTWLDLVVEDDGPGFSAEALRRGLDPFFTTKGGEGSGLGLSMVFDHASLAGGSVKLANRPGGGASVVLRLPYRPVAERTGGAIQGLMVLLVEDSPEIRAEVRDMLCAQGHSVIEAASAAEAEALARIEGLGLLLSDLNLAGDETGLALAQRLAAAGLPAGLLTSLPPEDPLHRAASAEFPVLAKPFGPEALAGFLARCLAPRRPAAA
jgi:CheY-like chemotaxis protein/anti-sigma regulatory factor (Ser/Thr protein kinase)